VIGAVPDPTTCQSLSLGTVGEYDQPRKGDEEQRKRTLRDVDEVRRDDESENRIRPSVLLVGRYLNTVPQVVLSVRPAPILSRHEDHLLEGRAELVEETGVDGFDGVGAEECL
jgi:hypothetical protein